jgi:hypothetical protein
MARKKYKKQYTTGGRVDMSKGGRVSLKHGGNHIKGAENQEPTKMKFGNPNPKSTKPVKAAKRNKPVRDLNDPTGQTFLDPKDVPPVTGTKPVQPTFTKAPTTGKGSDQMFIGREGDVRPQAQTAQAMSAQDMQDRFAGRGSPYEPPYRPPGTPPGETPPYTPPGTPPTDGTTTGTTEQFEAERAKRITQTGRTAEDLAAGEIPEGMLPEQELVRVKEGKEYDVETINLAARKGVSPEYVKEVGPEAVQQMEDVSTVDAVEGMEASTITPETVADKEVDVEAAREREAREIEDVAPGEITGDVRFATVDELQAEAAQAQRVDDVLGPDNDYLVKKVEGKDTTVSATPDAERSERQTILGEPAPDEIAAQIEKTVGYEAAKQRQVKGKAAQSAAADMIAETAELPPEIAAAVVQDPATVQAQIDTQPVEVQAAVAALPTEALVSSQMETLLGGMEDGEIPMWARPAVDAVNAGLARRGMSISTVGRDSLFNSIIQSALPMAQSNAQALQQRAAQNLSNEQQANLQQATQKQQLRMQNLANRQDAASQTAQMSQQMRVMQSQFDQQAVMATADQQQQTRLANLQNEQQAALVRSQNEQQMAMQNLGNEQQLNMTELQIEAARAGADQSAENQKRIAEMQVAADFLAKNAGFKQQMELANLTNDQQMRLANLSSRNQAASELLSNAEKIELANLNKTMQTNQLQAQLANQMGLAQLNVEQQTAIQNATTKANMDLTKFNAAQQTELANSKFMQTVALTDMNAEQQAIMQNATAMASMDLANLSTRERLAVENAKNFLAMDMANMSNEQQANMMRSQQEQQRLLSDQSAINAAKQFNAASENQTNQFMASLNTQINQFNSQQNNAAEQFNVQQQNAAEARRVGIEADINKANAAIVNQTRQFNEQIDFNRDQFNTQNALAIQQSNVEWRRRTNLADTAAENAINQENAKMAFGLTSAAQSFLWQELRDQADYNFRWANDTATRKTQAMIAAASSEGDIAKNWSTNFTNISSTVNKIFGT